MGSKIGTLKDAVKGTVSEIGDSNYKSIVTKTQWNELRFGRQPAVIVEATDNEDAIAAIQYAKQAGLKVSVRGGNHSWCGSSLRQGGMLIDLSNLNEISVDQKNLKASIQPANSNRSVMAKLAPLGLAFPVGHCPEVKASGYLLSGGMPWNQPKWGPACISVEAIELITANGELVYADKENHADLYWAARGAGPLFFAVATRYHLKLYPLPKTVICSTYYYSLDDVEQIGQWLDQHITNIPNCIELTVFLISAPKHLTEECRDNAGKVCMITASAFTNSEDEAIAALNTLETCPILDKCLSKSIHEPNTFDRLMQLSGEIWTDKLRCLSETAWTHDALPEILVNMREHFKSTPSEKSVFINVINTGSRQAKKPDPDKAAFSMISNIYSGLWSMWDKPEHDEENHQWHDQALKLIEPFTMGYYIGETDIIKHPDHAKKAFSPENWARLEEVRRKYDPDNLFYRFDEGLE